MNKRFFLLFVFFLLCWIKCSTDSNPLNYGNGIHVLKGIWNMGDAPREYKFRNLPGDIDFIPAFPQSAIESLSDSTKIKVVIEYWIYTSINDAELAMVERLDMSNLYMKNMIDFPLLGGEIGDNCWHQLRAGAVTFIRNNVRVSVTLNWNAPLDSSEIELVARKIDIAIITAPKVADANLVPAPVINSVDIISNLPTDWAKPVTVRVNATDPQSQKLWIRKYASGFSIISDSSVLTLIIDKYADSSGDPNKAKVKIWVWNEDHLVSSIMKEIPFQN